MTTHDMGLQRTAAHQGWMPGDGPKHVHHAERRGSSATALVLRQISGLAGQAYNDAPASVRAQLLEALLRPMSPYGLISVAGGVFAQIKGRNAEWQGFRVRVEDIASVDARAVAALVNRVHQKNSDAFDDMVEVVEASPALAGSAAASALVTLLQQRGRPLQRLRAGVS